MNRSSFTSLAAAAVVSLAALSAPGAAGADTLLIERVEAQDKLALPDRGLSMADVEARYGAPEMRLEPKGGQHPQWPVIHRWVYPQFTVYFERSHVIDVVARRATAMETGPKPVR